MKATRRSIRKAFGADAVDAITSRDQLLRHHATRLDTLDAALLSEQRERITADGDDRRAWMAAVATLQRPFWGRMRWLFLGR